MQKYRIFAINPGSTSTKIAMFENETQLFSSNISHKAEDLAVFTEMCEQLDYRYQIIENELAEQGISLHGVSAFVGRGGGVQTVRGGTYRVNEIMLEHSRIGVSGQHPSNLGALLADLFAGRYGGDVFVVNGPTVDEFQEVARITGLAGVYRSSIVHALNQKEVGIRYAAKTGRRYEELNLIITHIGGGVSVTAHRQGRMIDSNDIINGDGPLAPTRAGALPAVKLLRECFSGAYTEKQLYARITKNGGLVEHLGTSDAREVNRRIEAGDQYAKLIYDAMIYQIAKNIGACAAILRGVVDGIIITGGIAHDRYVVDCLKEQIGFLGKVAVMPGEFEMEALAAGALRVLCGQEKPLCYTGEPVWTDFEELRYRSGYRASMELVH